MKKGLQGIDFLGGLMMFMSLVIYIAFTAINTSENYDAAIRDNTLHQEAWHHSEKIVENITDGNKLVNSAKLTYFTDCTQESPTRYGEIRNRLSIDFDNTFRMTITHTPIGLADEPEGDNYIGTLLLKNSYSVTFIREGGVYPKVDIQGTTYDDDPASATPSFIVLEGTNYTVEKIDRAGQYVLLTKRWMCGFGSPTQRTVVVTERFLVKDNQLLNLRFEYW